MAGVAAAFLLGALLAVAAEARVPAERTLDLKLAGARVVSARVQVPVADAPVPAVILLGGFEAGAAALDRVSASRPTVMASFDYPFTLPKEKPALWAWPGLLREARQGIRDTSEAIGRLHAHLLTMPEVDPARITIVGVSLGAPFAVAAAADHGIPGLAVIHGFGRVNEMIAQQLIRRWEPDHGPWVRPLARRVARWMTWYADVPDIEDKARTLQAHQRVLMLIAADDDLVPASATAALIEALSASSAPVESETDAGAHLAGDTDPRIPALLTRTEVWMEDHGL
ncbi:MAG: hypothetical protein ACT4QA_16680 [Panacagrimonas sp.]